MGIAHMPGQEDVNADLGAQIPNTTESREMLIKVNGGVLIHCTKGKKLGISLTLHL